MQNQTQKNLKKEDTKEAISNTDGGENSWWGIDQHIKMRETVLEGVALFYASEPQACAKIYVENLNKLAYLYIEVGRRSEAMELADMASEVMEPLYVNDTELWEEEYCNNLICMVATYPHAKESRHGTHPEELALPMMEKLSIINPERWTEDYVSRLNDISIFYYNANENEIAATFMEKAVEATKKIYEKDPRSYVMQLSRLAIIYRALGKIDDALIQVKKALEISDPFYKKDPKDWDEHYRVAIGLMSSLLMDKEAYEESLCYFKKYYDLFFVQNIHLAKGCIQFIYSIVKCYQCSLLTELAKSSDTYFRDTFKEEYITILEQEHHEYKKLSASKKVLDVQKYEIFTLLFMPQ